jgi:hypothetical protein
MGAVSHSIMGILAWRSPPQITQPVVIRIPIKVAAFQAIWSRTIECRKDQRMNLNHLAATGKVEHRRPIAL